MQEKAKTSSHLLKIGLVFIALCLLLARIGYSQTANDPTQAIVLQGSIHIEPAKPVPGDQTGKIQPGTAVKLSATIENKGNQENPPGQFFIRYAFAHPLNNEEKSQIFETEKKSLPSIQPGKKVEIAFDTPHKIPSLLDFVRDDWSIREYQAVALIDKEEYLIGTLALTFSAYYYPGIKKEFPVTIHPNIDKK